MVPQRKTLQDLLADNPEGCEIDVELFHDVRDDDPTFDRVVIGMTDEPLNVSFTGVVILEASDIAAFKKTLNECWAGNVAKAKLLPPSAEGQLPRLTPVA